VLGAGRPSEIDRIKESEMKTQRSIAYLVVVLLLVSLTACKRPIPGNTNESTSSSDVPAVVSTDGSFDVLDQIYLFATQTAMATQGITTGVPQSLETGVVEPDQEMPPLTTELVPTQAPQVQSSPTNTPVPIIIPSPTPGLPSTHTLEKGEFPYCIARRYNIDPGALLRANNLTTYSVYYGGMTLTIPQNASKFPGSRALKPHPASYTVRSGDTLALIACAFGDVDPNMIAFANNLGPNKKISAGQVIQIP
jgi:LysM repeat protein